MKTASATGLGFLAFLVTAPAYGQVDRADADALRSSVLQVLSLATFGTVKVHEQAAQVTRNGADYRVRMPLEGFSAPPDAALEAVARPLAGGLWDILSMTIPSAGTIDPDPHPGNTNRVAYVLGEQNIHARIDPAFSQPSSFAAAFGGVGLRSNQDENQVEQGIDRYSVEGKVSAATAGRATFTSGNKAENWRLRSRMPDGSESDGFIKTMTGRLMLEDVDRAQGARFLTASRALLAETQQAASDDEPEQLTAGSIAQRRALRGMIDALEGLLTRFEADQTLDGIRFSANAANGGTIRRMHLNMRGDTANERLSGHMEIALDGFTVNSLSAETAAYMPHDVDLKSVLAGVRIAPLMALLRAATAPDADTAALQDQAMRLLNEPDVRFGIESMMFDSGPMRMTGSARAVPHAGGQLGLAIHLSATGVDALIAQAQKTPALQQALPMMYMAKGMARPDGAAVVWDIALGDGPITINGVPFGQSGARTR